MGAKVRALPAQALYQKRMADAALCAPAVPRAEEAEEEELHASNEW